MTLLVDIHVHVVQGQGSIFCHWTCHSLLSHCYTIFSPSVVLNFLMIDMVCVPKQTPNLISFRLLDWLLMITPP